MYDKIIDISKLIYSIDILIIRTFLRDLNTEQNCQASLTVVPLTFLA